MKLIFLCLTVFGAVQAHTRVIELKCNPYFDVNTIVNLPYRCLNGLSCVYENINMDKDTHLILNFDEANYALDCVGFVNSTLSTLPPNVFNKYRAVNSLYASKIGLTEIPSITFKNGTNLLDINLSGNNLKILESKVFSPCKKIRKLVLKNNEIEDIDMDAFDALDELEEIDLSYNKLKYIPHKSLAQLKGLKILNLNNNSLIVRYGQFPVSLESLDLSYNKLENFTLKSIISLVNLKYIFLNGNKMYRYRQHIFPDGIFDSSLKTLSHIQFSDNEFYCTTLADLIIWLEKHKIKVDVEAHLMIINSSNINGVGCKEEGRTLV